MDSRWLLVQLFVLRCLLVDGGRQEGLIKKIFVQLQYDSDTIGHRHLLEGFI
jgi:hypothetical protein